ncbi:MAG: hypothetical protein Greene07144_315 [Parcubacteria group bacterium Greene0714_4]|nr:MAG: hypothetical protein Greene07144_315 [Parcubacteria group bacterium Greene0714_4]
MSEGEPIIDTEPPMDASMSAKSQEAVADLERQLGSELSEEEAAAKNYATILICRDQAQHRKKRVKSERCSSA